MKIFTTIMILIMSASMIFVGCASWNKTQTAAESGATSGAMGAVIGRASGNTALSAIIGATVGGASGAKIGRQMDKQAEEIRNNVPDSKVERVGEGIVVEFNGNVLFSYNKSDLSDAAKTNLKKLVTVLNRYPNTDIECQGHSDSKGTESRNMDLSENRASAVSNYLYNNGISGSRVNIKGFGETAPKYNNETVEGRSQNRRLVFLITANEKMKDEARTKESS